MNYVIFGAGVAGVSAVKEISKNRSKEDSITVITKENVPFYYRPRLIEYLSGEVKEQDLIINDREWFEKNDIDLKLSEQVTEIDFDRKEVISDKNTYQYDKLLLANGAHSFVPPMKGCDKKNIFTLRTLSDAKKIYKKATESNKAVVIGGGLLGIEAASNLKKTGLDVTVVERANWCLNRQLDKKGGHLLIDILKKRKDLNFVLNALTEEFLGDDKVEKVKLENGDLLDVDLVLLSAGVRSNIGLFEDTDLKLDKAVKVNKYMKTNLEDVYAAGDIAKYDDQFYGIWLPSMKMGQTAGKNMSGIEDEFSHLVSSYTLKVAGINVVSAGNIEPNEEFNSEVERKKDGYKRVIKNKEGKAVGLVIVGDYKEQDKILAEVKS